MTAQLFVIAPKNHAFCTHKRANQFAAQQKCYKLPQNAPPNQMQCLPKGTKKQDQIVCQLGLADLFCKV